MAMQGKLLIGTFTRANACTFRDSLIICEEKPDFNWPGWISPLLPCAAVTPCLSIRGNPKQPLGFSGPRPSLADVNPLLRKATLALCERGVALSFL
jgi:hypothetical protein